MRRACFGLVLINAGNQFSGVDARIKSHRAVYVAVLPDSERSLCLGERGLCRGLCAADKQKVIRLIVYDKY